MTVRAGRARTSVVLVGTALGIAACGETHIHLLDPELQRKPDAAAPEAGVVKPDIDAIRRAACVRFVTDGDREQALLMFVIDVSNSMSTPYGTTGTRWDAERPVLASAVNALPASVGVGALYYPNMPTPPSATPRSASACVNTQALIPVNLLGAPDSRQRSRIGRSFSQVQPNTQGGTPTLDAYLVGLNALGSTTLGGTRQMLLITDGFPTFSEDCVGTGEIDDPVDHAPVIQAIDAARRAGVKTFVIGSPGSDSGGINGEDSRPWLSQAAEAGGTARASCSHTGPRYCHFDMASEPDLQGGLTRALAEIQDTVVRCDFSFPQTPDGDLLASYSVNVVLTGADSTQTLLPLDPSASCLDGWHYSDDQHEIVLCSRTCDTIRNQNTAELEFLFSCVGNGH
jgi:hypothetical protein